MGIGDLWLNKKIIFFGGKGGVGKTTFSASLSVFLSGKKNKKVLLISTDPAHNLSDIFQKRIKKNITKVNSRLDVLELDANYEAKKYLKSVKEIMLQNVHAKLFAQVDEYLKLAGSSPGLTEAALLDSLSDFIVNNISKYDHIIIDTAPTGHTLRLVLLPESMKNWIDLLMYKREKNRQIAKVWNDKKGDSDRLLNILDTRQKKFSHLKELIINSDITAFNFVLNPDSFSLEETKRAVKELDKGKIVVHNFIINKVIESTQEPQFKNYVVEQKETLAKIRKWKKKSNLIISPWYAKRIQGLDALYEFGSLFD
ncbi:MAG: ArsA family ATPase [Leptospirales bacterium]